MQRSMDKKKGKEKEKKTNMEEVEDKKRGSIMYVISIQF
jgi:hypothetical protein